MSLSPTVASQVRNRSLRGSLGTVFPVANQRNQGAHICSVGLVYRSMTGDGGQRGAPTPRSVTTRILSYFGRRWSVSYTLT